MLDRRTFAAGQLCRVRNVSPRCRKTVRCPVRTNIAKIGGRPSGSLSSDIAGRHAVRRRTRGPNAARIRDSGSQNPSVDCNPARFRYLFRCPYKESPPHCRPQKTDRPRRSENSDGDDACVPENRESPHPFRDCRSTAPAVRPDPVFASHAETGTAGAQEAGCGPEHDRWNAPGRNRYAPISRAIASIIVDALTCSLRRPSHCDPASVQEAPKNHRESSDLSTPSVQHTRPL